MAGKMAGQVSGPLRRTKAHTGEVPLSWQDQVRDKLMSPAEAAALVRPGDRVQIGFVGSPEPASICHELAKRSDLEGLQIATANPQKDLPWWNPEEHDRFDLRVGYLSPLSRAPMAARAIDFDIWSVFFAGRCLEGDRTRAMMDPDVFLTTVSPPDERGFCSFGDQLWYSRTFVEQARDTIVEVNPRFIRTGGDNYVHISEIRGFVEPAEAAPPAKLARQVAEENLEAAQTIGALASTLVNDGDTVQIGLGLISGATAAFLDEKNDLGMHTEIFPAGAIKLLRERVLTGRYKTVNRDRVVATAIFVEPEDLSFLDGHPALELRDAFYTNDPRLVAQHENFVAINNALAIDLTGQITAEAFGPVMFSGTGGQLDFVIGAMMSKGGRSVSVLPSTARGGTVSRIVPTFPPGQVLTIPRTLVDYVVTEYGIASLQGKSQRERAEALIEIAHPNFRDELRAYARKTFWR